MLPIKYLTTHCAATPEDRPNTAEEINRWDNDKFGQTSYHWVVEIDGKTVRGLADNVRGAHTGGHNTGNIGICYVGGLAKDGKTPKDTRSHAQKVSLRTLIRTYQERYPGIAVRGHRDWPNVAKACPSFDVGAWIAAGMPV